MSKTLCFEYLQTQFTERSGYAANKDRKNLSASYSWVKKYIDCNIKDNPFDNLFESLAPKVRINIAQGGALGIDSQ